MGRKMRKPKQGNQMDLPGTVTEVGWSGSDGSEEGSECQDSREGGGRAMSGRAGDEEGVGGTGTR
jgi:hypothetical protein